MNIVQVFVVFGFIVYGSYILMLTIHVPEPFTWIVPLCVFLIAMAIIVKWIWGGDI